MKLKVKKNIPKQKRHQIKKQNIFIKSFIALFYKLKPTTIVIIFSALLSSIFIVVSIYKFQTYSEKLLPTSIHIEIKNPQISYLVNEEMSKALFYARKAHEKRSHFLKRVNNILFSYDQIDQYWIRLGFDRKLQINATPQVPLLILEVKGGDKYVISSTSKIIAKNPASSEYPSLYNLSAPEIKLIWRPKSTLRKNKINYSNNVKLYTQNKNPVNLPWLVNQAKVIYTSFQNLGLNFFLSRVTWNSTVGFQFNLVGTTQSSNPQVGGDKILVLLGKENVAFKIKKLTPLFNDLAKKKLYPAEIDLDYTDKASFKVSNTESNKNGPS